MAGPIKYSLTGAALLVTLALVATTDAGAGSPIVLTNVTTRPGISFRHTDGSSGRHYLVEADVLDGDMNQRGLEPVRPTETVEVAQENGCRVSANGLYRKSP